jgi:hypothetical protein
MTFQFFVGIFLNISMLSMCAFNQISPCFQSFKGLRCARCRLPDIGTLGWPLKDNASLILSTRTILCVSSTILLLSVRF